MDARRIKDCKDSALGSNLRRLIQLWQASCKPTLFARVKHGVNTILLLYYTCQSSVTMTLSDLISRNTGRLLHHGKVCQVYVMARGPNNHGIGMEVGTLETLYSIWEVALPAPSTRLYV